jgi:hypothetical protein
MIFMAELHSLVKLAANTYLFWLGREDKKRHHLYVHEFAPLLQRQQLLL